MMMENGGLPGLVNVNKKRTGKIHHAIHGNNSRFRLGDFPSLCKKLPEGIPVASSYIIITSPSGARGDGMAVEHSVDHGTLT